MKVFMAQAKPNDKSRSIVDKAQKRKFRQIFNMLDSDKDGLISSSSIDISQLSTDVLEAFSPLLIEMEEIDQTLDLKTFCLAGSRLF